MEKIYVAVTLKTNTEGVNRPLTIEWNDGHIYEIDKVRNIVRAASTKVGGCGIRYTISVLGKETYLFQEDNRWFVEAKRQ